MPETHFRKSKPAPRGIEKEKKMEKPGPYPIFGTKEEKQAWVEAVDAYVRWRLVELWKEIAEAVSPFAVKKG